MTRSHLPVSASLRAVCSRSTAIQTTVVTRTAVVARAALAIRAAHVLRAAPVILTIGGVLASSPAAAQSPLQLFDWGGPLPNRANLAWRATVIPPPRVANPGWAATITYLRPEPRVPTAAMAAIPRRATTLPRAQSAAVTGPGGHALDGIASYYWQDQMTASGERFDRTALTAAHRTLPIGSRVRVTNAVNGRSVIVRINDRGPFKPGRVIDLSEAAARVIDMERAGLVPVTVDVLGGNG